MALQFGSSWRTKGPSGDLLMRSGRMTKSSGLAARGAAGGQRGRVRQVDVAAARVEGLFQLHQVLDHHRPVRQLALLEVIDQVLFVDGARLHADLRAVQFGGALDAQLLRHHEALAVVEHDAGRDDAQAGVAARGDGGVAVQHVDLAALQRGKALLRTERHEAGLGRVAQHGGGQRAAQVGVQAGPAACASAMDRPAEPWLTPQTSSPRFLMASTVGPACRAGHGQRRGRARRGLDEEIDADASCLHACPVFVVCKKGMHSRCGRAGIERLSRHMDMSTKPYRYRVHVPTIPGIRGPFPVAPALAPVLSCCGADGACVGRMSSGSSFPSRGTASTPTSPHQSAVAQGGLGGGRFLRRHRPCAQRQAGLAGRCRRAARAWPG